jgi:hypothetical protein
VHFWLEIGMPATPKLSPSNFEQMQDAAHSDYKPTEAVELSLLEQQNSADQRFNAGSIKPDNGLT